MEYLSLKTRSEAFAWRFPIGFQALFLLILLVAIPFYPESPRYLMKIQRIDNAREVLTQCRVDPTGIKIEQEMIEIEDAIRLEASGTSHSFRSMLFEKDRLHTRRRILLGAGIQVMQKFTGIDFISTYAPEMFTLAGYSGNTPALLGGGNYLNYVLSLALSIYCIDRVGRRKLMLVGSSMMGVVLTVGGILAHEVVSKSASGNQTEARQLGAGVATVLYLFTFLYGSTWLTTWYVGLKCCPNLADWYSWVYPTEIFPLASRAKGVALSTVAFSIAGGVINEIVPYLINAIGFWVFIFFALVNFAMLVPIYVFYIGRSYVLR
jgi:hypothetical protein